MPGIVSQEMASIPSRKAPVCTCPTHYYVDVPHAEESTYKAHGRHTSINPTIHAELQEHNNNISYFRALPEIILARKRKRHQPLLDFSKSKILTSLAYTQGCEELLVQRISHEAKAKRKAAEKEATEESSQKEKEKHQWQVRECQQAHEVTRLERERLQVVKRAASGGRRC